MKKAAIREKRVQQFIKNRWTSITHDCRSCPNKNFSLEEEGLDLIVENKFKRKTKD